jgi:TolB-like protein/Tfp pilus assembly protein PilF
VSGFIAELKRRNVIRMAGLYLVGAWLITQVAGTVLPMYEAPAWVARSIVTALAIGFIPAMIFAWVFELTPDGLKRDSEIQTGQSIAPQTAQKMNRLIAALLVLAVIYFGVDKFYLAPKREAALVTQTTQAITEQVASQEKSENEKSIAVLAFENRSADKDNEYFSDGVAEEILNSLAKVKDLKVAGRTSSFFFKGKNENLTTIGKTLGVAHVLEGSVRKQGDKLRITAQLIRVSDGFQLWSETFDGTDADIFALQENIARRVTGELKVALNAGQQNQLIDAGTNSPEAYALYLQATDIFNRRDTTHYQDAVAALQKALALDPKYARAHSRLATLYATLGAYMDIDFRQTNAKAIKEANAALALDPSLAEPHAVLGLTYGKQRGGFLRGREEFERAIALDPDDVNSNFWYGLSLVMTGYREAGIARFEHALSIDPMMPNIVRWRGLMYFLDGDLNNAELYLGRARSSGLLFAERELSYIAFQRGDVAMAIRKWTAGTESLQNTLPPGSTEIIANGIYGDAQAKSRALALIDDVLAQAKPLATGTLPLSLLILGSPERALSAVLKLQDIDNSDFFARLWSANGKQARVLPEFPAFLQKMGLVELWDKYGPPDVCRKSDKGDYVCE